MSKTYKYKSKESYQRSLDAQARGRTTIKNQAIEKRKLYQENPSLCMQCNKSLDFEKRTNKFCSHSCSASYNNLGRVIDRKTGLLKEKENKTNKFCLNCGEPIEKCRRKYCSSDCAHIHRKEMARTQALENLVNGSLTDGNARSWFRKLFEHKCAICGLSEWRGEEIPLVVDHIDGNYKNNFLNNLRIICCNCDGLLPTYRSRNRGNGRINKRL